MTPSVLELTGSEKTEQTKKVDGLRGRNDEEVDCFGGNKGSCGKFPTERTLEMSR